MNTVDTIIRTAWPSLADDLADGVSADTVRDRAADTFDGEEYGRLCALLEVRETQQHVTVVIDPHDSDGVYVFAESEDAERFMAAKGNEDAYMSEEPIFDREGAAELLRAVERDEAGAMSASDGLGA